MENQAVWAVDRDAIFLTRCKLKVQKRNHLCSLSIPSPDCSLIDQFTIWQQHYSWWVSYHRFSSSNHFLCFIFQQYSATRLTLAYFYFLFVYISLLMKNKWLSKISLFHAVIKLHLFFRSSRHLSRGHEYCRQSFCHWAIPLDFT